MTPVITPRERWIALGMLVGVLALVYAVFVHPWWTVPMQETAERIEQLRERDARLRMQLAQAPLVEAQLHAVQVRLASQPGFLPEASAELATAGLVQRLETVVQQASPGNRSCIIRNRSPLPAAKDDGFTRVAVQVRLQCGTPELAMVLHALEAGTPRVFIENFNTLAQRFFFAGGGMNAGDGRDGGLDVSFDLVGYVRPGDAAPVDGMQVGPGAGVPEPTPIPPAGVPEPIQADPGAPVPLSVEPEDIQGETDAP